MPKALNDLVKDLSEHVDGVKIHLKASLRVIDDIATDKITGQINEEKAAVKKLFASFKESLSSDLKKIADPKTKPDDVATVAKAVKRTISTYETEIKKCPDRTQNLSLLTSKLVAISQHIQHIIDDPSDLSRRKKPLVEDWSKCKKNVESATYDALEEVLKTSKKDKQRYLDMRKAIGTIFSAKTLELLGIMIQLTPENAVDICEKINVPFADIVTKLKKEKLFQVQMSTLEVDKTVNSLIMYMTFTRDTLRDIAKL